MRRPGRADAHAGADVYADAIGAGCAHAAWRRKQRGCCGDADFYRASCYAHVYAGSHGHADISPAGDANADANGGSDCDASSRADGYAIV
jgi:hypothetical protein